MSQRCGILMLEAEMAPSELNRLLKEAESLTAQDLALLLQILQQRVKALKPGERPRWRDARGTAEPAEVDAQEWISRERAEADRDHGIHS